MPWGAIIGAVGAVASGVIGSSASKGAADSQANAAQQASAAELGMFNQTQQNLAPWLGAGQNGLIGLERLLNIGPGSQGGPSSPILAMLGLGPGGTGQINPSTFQGSPGYQYQLQQGMNAVTNANAPGSGGLGGNALRALQSTGQGLANQNWNQYLGNASGAFNSLVGNVANLSAGGQNAAANLGGIATTVGGQIGSNAIGAGNALAAGQIGSANALGGALGGLGNNALLYTLLNQSQSGGNGLFSGSGPFSANTLNSNFGTQFGAGTFPSASNPNAIVPGYGADNFTPLG